MLHKKRIFSSHHIITNHHQLQPRSGPSVSRYDDHWPSWTMITHHGVGRRCWMVREMAEHLLVTADAHRCVDSYSLHVAIDILGHFGLRQGR